MKSFTLVLSIFLLAGTSQSMPQYGPPPSGGQTPKAPAAPNPLTQPELPKGCRFVYRDFHSIVHVETEEEVCSPYTENVCEVKYRKVCTPYEDQECRKVIKQECQVKEKEVCNDLLRDVTEDYTVEECNDEYTRACESKWVTYENGDKVWEEDPETCKEIPETVCKPVKKTRTKQEPYTTCNLVPYDDCRDVEDQECIKVIRDSCEQKPYDDCKDVTKDKCENVHKKVPESHTERKQVKVCNDDEVDNDVVPFIRTDDESEIIDKLIQDGARFGGAVDDEEAVKSDEPFVFSR